MSRIAGLAHLKKLTRLQNLLGLNQALRDFHNNWTSLWRILHPELLA